MPDGFNGLAGIQHWLVSIQARAPNSPVIIVGTHYDAIADVSIQFFSENNHSNNRNQF